MEGSLKLAALSKTQTGGKGAEGGEPALTRKKSKWQANWAFQPKDIKKSQIRL